MIQDTPSPELLFTVRDDVTAYRPAPSVAGGAATAGMFWPLASLHCIWGWGYQPVDVHPRWIPPSSWPFISM